MSWQSLSDVYSERVLRNTSSTTMNNTQKDWKPLSEVYANNAQRGYLEEGKVLITLDNKTLPEFDLADIYVKEILQRARFHSVDLEKSIEDWVDSGGWKDKDKAPIIDFLTKQINLLNNDIRGNYDVNDKVAFNAIKEQIELIISNKGRYKGFTTKFQNKEFNYIDMLKGQAGEVFSEAFIKAVYEYDFKKSNNVNVGPGELVTTLFTEATAPEKKGDLDVGGILIELKKEGGIVGLADPGKALLKHMSDVVGANYIEQLRADELKNFNEYIKSNKDLIQKAIDSLEKEQEEKAEKRKFLNKDKRALLDLLQLLIAGNISFTEIEKAKISQKMLNIKDFSSLEELKTLIDTIKDITGGAVAKTNNLFFNNKLRNDPPQSRHAVELYLNSTNIGRGEDILNIIKQSNLEPLKKIGALAIVDYQIKEGFDYIFLTGPNYRTVVIGPIKGSSADKIKLVFESIGEINFKMSGGRDKGKFEMFLGPAPAGDSLTDLNNAGLQNIQVPAPATAIIPPAPTTRSEGETLNIPI